MRSPSPSCRIAIVLTAALLAPVTVRAQAPATWEPFRQQFEAYVKEDGVVGASVLLLDGGRIAARHDVGLADRTRGKVVDDQTIYHWGSITKTLTAIAIMQLRDRGRLTLDDRITRYLPELRQVHDPFGMMDSITIRMLLSHSAGFMGSTWPYDEGRAWEPFEPTTWSQLVAMMPYQSLQFRPGTRYGYSNPAFIYLARIVEQLTGDPWDAYVHKNIFAPLGLGRSYFRSTPYHLAAHRSHNYSVKRDSAGNTVVIDNGADFDPGITTPNGGWNSPLADLAAYTAFLLNVTLPGGTREHYDTVLSRRSLEEMWRPVVPMAQGYQASSNQHIGLSFFLLERGGARIIGHTGSQAGFRSFFYFNPANGRAVIAAFNSTTEGVGSAAAFQRMHSDALALLR